MNFIENNFPIRNTIPESFKKEFVNLKGMKNL